MGKKLTIFTIAALACIIASASAIPPVYGGSITVESKSIKSGESFVVSVFLEGNDIGLTSLKIPLKFDGRYLTCTYVDFSGSLKNGGMTGYYEVDDGSLEISYIPSVVNPLPTITAASGLIATIYFTAAADAPDITLQIDSVNNDAPFEQFATTFHRWTRLEVADNTGGPAMVPAFTAGNIEIRRPTDVQEGGDGLNPEEFALAQNHPNPFNPTTRVSFTLPGKAVVKLEVFNLLGQTVATLADREFSAGSHEIIWDAAGQPSGIYFYRIFAAGNSITRKMLLLK